MIRMNDNKPLTLYVVSDSLGEPGEVLAKAGRGHFENSIEDVRVFSFVHEKREIDQILAEAKGKNALIVCTITTPELLKCVKESAKEKKVPVYDVLDPFLDELRILTGVI